MRLLSLAGIIGVIHFVTTLALGVLAFMAQGNLTNPGPPSFFHSAVSAVVDVLEFPLVIAVRKADPERLSGFMVAAVANSLFWGAMCCLAWLFIRKMREIPDPGPGRS
jgi:hypothetical protein